MTREVSYVSAIVAAGITYSIMKNCTDGIIPECGKCNNKLYKSHSDKDWILEECPDNMSFSSHLTRNLLKSFYKNKDDVSKAILHNHRIGITVSKK